VTADGQGTPRLFVDGRFQTPTAAPAWSRPGRGSGRGAVDAAYPMSLNTGRIRDQWHTMTRTGLAPDLCRHAPEPFVEVHPADAEALGVKDGALARVITARGEAVALAKVTDRQRPAAVHADALDRRLRAVGPVQPLVAPNLDPTSGQPEFKHTPARLRAYRETWKGFFLTRDSLAPPAGWTSSGGASPRTPASSTSSPAGATRSSAPPAQGPDQGLPAGELVTSRTPPPARGARPGSRRPAGRGAVHHHQRPPAAARLAGRAVRRDPEPPRPARPCCSAARPGAPVDKGPLVCACLKVGAKAVRPPSPPAPPPRRRRRRHRRGDQLRVLPSRDRPDDPAFRSRQGARPCA
jgi:assimilatory nitrate reductase catalytic subunit